MALSLRRGLSEFIVSSSQIFARLKADLAATMSDIGIYR
jgi:hypothetical protein